MNPAQMDLGIPLSGKEKNAFKEIRESLREALGKVESVFKDELEKLKEIVQNDELAKKVDAITQQVDTLGETIRGDLLPYITTELMGESQLSEIGEKDKELGKKLSKIEKKESKEEALEEKVPGKEGTEEREGRRKKMKEAVENF